MKYLFSLLLLFLIGCTTAQNETGFSERRRTHQSSPGLTHIKKITVGLDKEAVAFLMRDSLVIGYRQNPGVPGALEPIKISQPYKSEIVFTSDGNREVYYYYTHIHKDDGIVSEEELTPLIFDDQGVVVGIGREYLEKLWQQNRVVF